MIVLREEIENKLIEEQKKAMESDRLKSAFLANMSHEIRTPMNAIIGFSELLEENIQNEKDKDVYVKLIRKNSDMLLSLINDIVDISKIEAGEVVLKHKTFNINKVLLELSAIFKPQATLKGLNFLYEESLDNGDLLVTSDDTKLRQIMTNLIGNALKFTFNGFIKIGYVNKGDYLEFFVQDTGMGISAENREMVFERFRQVDSSLTKKEGGTGLGLSICKALVKILGGELWIESEIDFGSTFYFTIPTTTEITEEIHETEIVYKDSYDWSGKEIIIAEDEETNFIYINKDLESTNISIIRASNGKECVDLVESHPNVTLILMDIKMPVMNGYEATAIIKAKHPHIKIIAQTAYVLANDYDKVMAASCDGYITKPLDREKLFSIIDRNL